MFSNTHLSLYSVHIEKSQKSNAELLRNQMANISCVGSLSTCQTLGGGGGGGGAAYVYFPRVP